MANDSQKGNVPLRGSFWRRHVQTVGGPVQIGGWQKVSGKFFFQRGSGTNERTLSHRSHSTVLLFAIPWVFLPDDDLFLTYTSLGTPPLGHWTSLQLEITSSWKPISRNRQRKGNRHHRMKTTFLYISPSPLRQRGIYVCVIFTKSRYRANKHRC